MNSNFTESQHACINSIIEMLPRMSEHDLSFLMGFMAAKSVDKEEEQ